MREGHGYLSKVALAGTRRVFLGVEIADPSLRYEIGRKAALCASETRETAADERLTPLVAPDTFALRLADLEIG